MKARKLAEAIADEALAGMPVAAKAYGARARLRAVVILVI